MGFEKSVVYLDEIVHNCGFYAGLVPIENDIRHDILNRNKVYI